MPIVSRPDFLPNLPSWSRKALFALALSAICFTFAFPVLWLILTSVRPESGVYYVHRGTEFTLGNFAEVLRDDRIVEAFVNSALIATLATIFSLLMKGFFDGIDPSMEYAAMIDGCSRWGAFVRVAVPSALPAISALAVLCWLFTWNEFLFALILTGNRVPMITVVMAQFVTEMGLRWNLMAATAVMALVPAFLLALFGQKYVIRGLRI